MADAMPTFRDQPIPQTSLATPSRHPLEVVVRFNRWAQVGVTAYQKGQYAGFLLPEAERMVAKGLCKIVPMAEPHAVTHEPSMARSPLPVQQPAASQQRRA